MSTITNNCNIGGLTGTTSTKSGAKTGTGLRALICASLAVAITSLTAQVISTGTSAASIAEAIGAASVSQLAQTYSAVSLHAAATLPAITVVAAR
ncbi:MAG: hypothetical protein ACREU2_03105 [Steroidobacteraceae bacterium]